MKMLIVKMKMMITIMMVMIKSKLNFKTVFFFLLKFIFLFFRLFEIDENSEDDEIEMDEGDE